MNNILRFYWGLAALTSVGALSAEPLPLTLPQAVARAAERYPAVRVSAEQAAAAAAGINLARTSYLPRADLLGQVNRATPNNVFGMLLPQAVIPSISGPVLGTNGLTSVWGSAVGVLVSWEPFDFGSRKASVEAAQISRRRAELAVGRTRLDVETGAADAFLTLLAAGETVRAAQAGLDRAEAVERVVGALVRSGLRPGADEARTRAEVALARTQLFQAEQAAAVARASLAEYLGLSPAELSVRAGPLLGAPPASDEGAGPLSDHPAAREQSAAVDEVRARQRVLERSGYPRFNLQATSFARGTGARTDGTTGDALAGLGPNIQNWAVGMSVTFPLAELPSLRARKQVELHKERAEAARYEQVLQELSGRLEKAKAILAGARRIAQNTPIQVEAATSVRQQAMARYKSGLVAVIELAEAERLATQAEIDDALARLIVWRALLGVAAARGDLGAFLDLAGR